jgi:hypothetical protein
LNFFDRIFILQGFLSRYTPELPIRPASPPLFLAAVGNVGDNNTGKYDSKPKLKIAVSFAIPAFNRAKRWIYKEDNNDHQKTDADTLSDYLLDDGGVNSPNTMHNPLKVGATIRVNQSISTDEFLRLFRKAFEGASWRSYSKFEDTLTKCIAAEKLLKDEELSFYWFDDGDLMISKNRDVRGRILIKDVSRRLLKAFVDKDKNISSDLYDSLCKNIPNRALK